jgi:hypothetical protein
VRDLDFLVGAAFLLGPMVYALTLNPQPQQCEAVSAPASVEPFECECPEPVTEPPKVEPAKVELPPAEPEVAKVEPEPEVAKVEPSLAEPRQFMFVAGDGQFVVFADDVDPRWGRGELFEPPGDEFHRAAKLADPALFPAADWTEDRVIDLYDGSGKVCSAKIDRLLVIAQYGYGSEGLGLEFWDDEANAPFEHGPERVRQATWDTQPHWLVGELDQSCSSALWARDAALPAPTILTRSDEPSATTRARLAQFERSSAVADLREDYEEHRTGSEASEDLEDWNTRMADQQASVEAWIDASGDAHFVELIYGFDDEHCGSGWDTEFTAFESVRGDAFEPNPNPVGASAIFDADLDGRFEMLFVHMFDDSWGRSLNSETEALDLSLAIDQDFVCPC